MLKTIIFFFLTTTTNNTAIKNKDVKLQKLQNVLHSLDELCINFIKFKKHSVID